MPRFAASVALRIASGTSRALPWPKPTRPFWSPTTTSAAKPKRRPPFTTLATRLIWTRRSTNSPSPSLRSSWRPPLWCSLAMSPSHCAGGGPARLNGFVQPADSKIQAALAGGLRQRLDAAVIEVARAVEHDRLHAGGACALGDEAPDLLRRVDVRARLQLPAHLLFEGRGGSERDAALVIDDLRVDLLRRAVHRQPRAAVRRLADGAPDPCLAAVLGSEFLSHEFGPLLLLAFLAEDELVGVLHALALVGLGLTELADLGGGLPDL